jgi:hypothetical protein
MRCDIGRHSSDIQRTASCYQTTMRLSAKSDRLPSEGRTGCSRVPHEVLGQQQRCTHSSERLALTVSNPTRGSSERLRDCRRTPSIACTRSCRSPVKNTSTPWTFSTRFGRRPVPSYIASILLLAKCLTAPDVFSKYVNACIWGWPSITLATTRLGRRHKAP